MEFSLLGPVVVSGDGGRVELGGPRQRAVLAVLLLSAGRVVDTEALIDQVWDDTPPPKPLASLRAYVTNLRRVLDDDSVGRLLTDGHGYRLRLAPEDTVDVHRFEQWLTLGRRRLDDGTPAEALSTLHAALALWRGTPLSDFRDHAFAHSERHRLEALRFDAIEVQFEAQLRLGDNLGLIHAVQAALTEHPLREQLWAQLMLAQYRAGRRGDALATYDRMTVVFNRELGVSPGGALQRLVHDIRSEAAHLAGEATPQPPDPGAGRPVLVGRRRELDRLRSALSEAGDGHGSVVVLVGDSGIGKTSVAAEMSREAPKLGIGTVWVGHARDLGASSSTQAWTHVVRALAGLSGGVAGAAPPSTDGDRPDNHTLMVEAMCAAVVEQVTHPVLIVLDDLQLGSRLSLDVLTALAAALPRLPVLIVATWQHPDAAPPPELGRILAGGGVTSLWLPGLARPECAQLIEAVSGTAPEDALLERMTQRTGGNPFYLTELTRLLTQTNTPADSDQVPLAVTGVITGRLAALPSDTAAAVTAAALLGTDFPLTRLAAALNLAPEVVARRLAPACRAGLVAAAEPGRYRFSHGLVRDAVVTGLDTGSRSRLHAGIARAYVDDDAPLDDDVSAAAEHAWRAGTDVNTEVALTLVRRAGTAAWNQANYVGVAALSRRGLEICARLPAGNERLHHEAQLWLQVASAEAVVKGQTSREVTTALRRSREISSHIGPLAVDMALRGLAACGAGRYREGSVIAESLVAFFAETSDAVAGSAGYYLRGLINFAAGDVDACLECIDTLLYEVPTVDWRRDGHLAAFDVRGYGVAAWVYAMRDEPQRAHALVATGLDIADARHDAFGSAILATSQLQIGAIRGDHTWLAERAEATAGQLIGIGFDQLAGTARIIGGWAHGSGPGNPDTRAEISDAIAEHSRDGTRIFLPLYYALLSDVQLAQGDSAAARASLHRAELTALATGERVWDTRLAARLAALPRERRRSPDQWLSRTSQM